MIIKIILLFIFIFISIQIHEIESALCSQITNVDLKPNIFANIIHKLTSQNSVQDPIATDPPLTTQDTYNKVVTQRRDSRKNIHTTGFNIKNIPTPPKVYTQTLLTTSVLTTSVLTTSVLTTVITSNNH